LLGVHGLACCSSLDPGFEFVLASLREQIEYRVLRSSSVRPENCRTLLCLHDLEFPVAPHPWFIVFWSVWQRQMHIIYESEAEFSGVSSPKHWSGETAQGPSLANAALISVPLRELTALDTWNQLRLANTQYDAEPLCECEPTLLVEEYGIFAHFASMNTAFWNDQGSYCKSNKAPFSVSFSFFELSAYFHTSPRTGRIAFKLRCCLYSLNSLFKLIWQWISGIKMRNLWFARPFGPWLNVF